MHEYKTLLSEADMGPLKKVLSLMDLDFDELKRGISGTIGSGNNSTNFQMRSNIAKEAKGLTAVFPVLVSESVSVEQAQMIAKAAERKYVTMFQMLFAASQITDAKSAQSYLKKFHNNITSSLDLSDMTVDDVIDFANKLDESVQTTALDNARITEATKAVLEDLAFNEDYTRVLSENLNPVSLNNYKIKTVFGDYKATQVSEANDTYTTVDVTDSEEWEGINKDDKNPRKYRKVTTTRTSPMSDRDRTAALKDRNTTLKDKADIISKQIVATDIKKANEATPSLMIINFVTQANGQDNEIVNTAVIGVKCVIHYISSSEMMNRMVLKNTDRRGLLNLIRATTGEIQFFRDFLFAIDRAKIDAVAKTNKGSNSRIWKMLEIRANRAKMNTTARADNASCAAITMLVLSKAEVEIIKQSYRLDLSKASNMLSIMKGYNFIGVAIIDEVNEKVDFLYDDGTKNFETISFMSLEREQGAGEYKKMINTLVKGR